MHFRNHVRRSSNRQAIAHGKDSTSSWEGTGFEVAVIGALDCCLPGGYVCCGMNYFARGTKKEYAMTQYPTFERGQIVRDCYGHRLTVLYQSGCQVFVVEYANTWYHPTKLFPVKDSLRQDCYSAPKRS